MLPTGTEELIDRALAEDIGAGDHTTLSTIPEGEKGSARLLVKQAGVLAGVELAQAIAHRFDPGLALRPYLIDGAAVQPGEVAFHLSGAKRSLLTVERVLLNFMQRLSGIASLTRRYVDAVEGTGCTILDTRKTTPTLRALEKWAVKVGGGGSHRHGLYDMILIKDNHIDLSGGIAQAIGAAHRYMSQQGLDLKIEVEVRDLAELEQVLRTGGIHRVMLDNFAPMVLRKAVQLVGGRFETEASGGITLEGVRAYAETGVDFISVGALTHSAPSLDLSLKAS